MFTASVRPPSAADTALASRALPATLTDTSAAEWASRRAVPAPARTATPPLPALLVLVFAHDANADAGVDDGDGAASAWRGAFSGNVMFQSEAAQNVRSKCPVQCGFHAIACCGEALLDATPTNHRPAALLPAGYAAAATLGVLHTTSANYMILHSLQDSVLRHDSVHQLPSTAGVTDLSCHPELAQQPQCATLHLPLTGVYRSPYTFRSLVCTGHLTPSASWCTGPVRAAPLA